MPAAPDPSMPDPGDGAAGDARTPAPAPDAGVVGPDPRTWPTGRLLSSAARLVERQWDERLRGIGLTHAAVVVLTHLAVGGPANPDALARAVRVRPQTMTRTLDRMERDGLVERRAAAEDRRRRVVTITDAGAAAWQAAQRLERTVLPEDDALRAGLLRILGDERA